MLEIGPDLASMTTVYSVDSDIESIVDRFPKVAFGVSKLSGYQLKLHIDRKVRAVPKKPRWVP